MGTSHDGRINALARAYQLGRDQDRLTIFRWGLEELRTLYPELRGFGCPPLQQRIADALGGAAENGGRIPMDTPPLRPTMEAPLRRDPTVTLPPRERDEAQARLSRTIC